MRGVKLLFALSLMCGCSGQPTSTIHTVPNSIVTPPSVITEVPQVPTRTDLKKNWFEIRGDTWSYGLPPDFKSNLHVSNGILAEHQSKENGLTINLTTHNNEAGHGTEALQEFVLDKFLPVVKQQNRMVSAIESNDQTTQYFTIVVHTITPNNTPDAGSFKFDAALDFFMQKDTTIYHMSCFSDAMNLKQHNSICFDVIDTLRVH